MNQPTKRTREEIFHYLTLVLERVIETSTQPAAVPRIEEGIGELSTALADINSYLALLKGYTPEEIEKAITFLKNYDSLEVVVKEEQIDELDQDITLAIDKVKQLTTYYQKAIAHSDVYEMERLKGEINHLSASLTPVWITSEKLYRKTDQFASKYLLPRLTEEIERRESISTASAKAKAQRTPEFIKLKEVVDQLFMLKSTVSVVSDKLSPFQKDVMQSVSTINRAIPNK